MKINTTTCKTPVDIKVDIERIYTADSGRTEDGTLFLSLVAKKRKLFVKWGILTNAEILKLETLIESSVFLTIEYPDPLTGLARIGTFQPSSNSSSILKLTPTLNGNLWSEVSCNFIEK